jgi:hypothetical protein
LLHCSNTPVIVPGAMTVAFGNRSASVCVCRKALYRADTLGDIFMPVSLMLKRFRARFTDGASNARKIERRGQLSGLSLDPG